MKHPISPLYAISHPLARSLRDKGWSITNAAKYLGVTRQHLYNIIRRPPKGALWDCVAAGLPVCSPAILSTLPPSPKRPPRQPSNLGFELGDGFTCNTENNDCREGIEGYIAEIQVGKPETMTLLRMPHADLWVTTETLFNYYSPNGKTPTV